MVVIEEAAKAPLESAILRSMFEARKRVFVDLLKWDIPVIDGRYELDQFDGEHAVYLALVGRDGRHLRTRRLLPTMRPHLLDSLFPELCVAEPPGGPGVMEITRFCLDRSLGAARRLQTRNRLVVALARYALARGIHTYTGVAEMGWLQQILAFGWRCRPLGAPRVIAGQPLGALRIDITAETPALLERAFSGAPAPGQASPTRKAA